MQIGNCNFKLNTLLDLINAIYSLPKLLVKIGTMC